jgi:hypothetical protein
VGSFRLDDRYDPYKLPLMSAAPNTFGGPPPPRERLAHRLRRAIPILALMFCWSCGGGTAALAEATAAREAFIATFLDLRAATVNSGSADIEDAVRDSILDLYGVSGQDLVDFVETHGEDVEFMHDLWTEVEARLIERLERNARDAENEASDGAEKGEAAEDSDGAEDSDDASARISP